MLRSFEIKVLVDVRTVPRSRRNPQFEGSTLKESLEKDGIEYQHTKQLGGLRKPLPHSRNTGWRNDSFRGYADYMSTSEFREGLEKLRKTAGGCPTAIMCAEAVPWRCHRNLIADAVVLLHQDTVLHIMAPGKANQHKPTSFASLEGADIVYAPVQGDMLEPLVD